jgi:hypothetical protein
MRSLTALLVLLVLGSACGGSGSKPLAATTAHTRTTQRPRVELERLRVRRIGSLPRTLSKASAVALPGGRLMVLGGYRGGASLDTISAGTPERLRLVGRLPEPTHDAAAARLGTSVYLFGGGEAASWPYVVRVSLSGSATRAPSLDEPLSDLEAVTIDGRAYLVGGYTGTEYASAVLRYEPSGKTTVVARLPQGTRYAGVAAIGRTIYVAGGLTPAGDSRAVYALPLGGHVRRIGTLPAPEAHAALAALGGELYYVGGRACPPDRSAHGEGDGRGTPPRVAHRPDRDDGRQRDRRRRRRDERRLVAARGALDLDFFFGLGRVPLVVVRDAHVLLAATLARLLGRVGSALGGTLVGLALTVSRFHAAGVPHPAGRQPPCP